MERRGSSRRRLEKKQQQQQQQQQHMPQHEPAKPPSDMQRQKTSEKIEKRVSAQSEKIIQRAFDLNGMHIPYVEDTRLHNRGDMARTVLMGKHSGDGEEHYLGHARNYTVGNVGAGGTLQLKPTRLLPNNFTYAPATPPGTSEDGLYSVYLDADAAPLLRESNASGTWTPRVARGRNTAMGQLIGAPPLSLANQHARPRATRSHSCSTVSDRLRTTLYDANEFNLPLADGDIPSRRRRSSSATRFPRHELDVQIPHYRLGTPHFSDRGTAYLHYSMHTNSSVPSSVLSIAEYDKLFPLPAGRGVSFYSHLSQADVPPFHPSIVHGRDSAPFTITPVPSTRPSIAGVISAELFNKLEANLHDPSLVHYHPTSGRIVAATPARLIAQITSPQFLDYELLADFFLTFRCFMPQQDVLEFLFARMRWAFRNGEDGRIARVRTFVALRHWILNYFQDDFFPDAPFRQSFCRLVNELAVSLRQRADRGGGDINIVGELKKCWRRTCALYWPNHPDAHEVSPDTDIMPGGIIHRAAPAAFSELSLPLTIRPTTARASIFEMQQIELPERPDAPIGFMNQPQLEANGPSQRSTVTTRTASIPASPMSAQSLEVLSCSIPFLFRSLRPSARAREKLAPKPAARPVAKKEKDKEQEQDKGKKHPVRPKHTHKRSGSFSDALRDRRTPLSSPRPDTIELKDLPDYAITGGLVRGLLLTPAPAKVDSNIPVTPGVEGPELTEARLQGHNDGYFGQGHNMAVKKIVGEMKRALSSRKASSESPGRSIGSGSAGSASTVRGRVRVAKKLQPDYQQLPGPDRMDILGLTVENTFADSLEIAHMDRARRERQLAEEKLSENEHEGFKTPPEHPLEKAGVHEKGIGAEYYREKALPQTNRPDTSRPSTARNHASDAYAKREESIDVMDFGRYNSQMNSQVTTGDRSIMIIDATGAPELQKMSGALGQSFSSTSSNMVPSPLYNRTERPPVPAVPKHLTKDYAGVGAAAAAASAHYESRWPSSEEDSRTSDQKMHDLLTEPNAWDTDYGSNTFDQKSDDHKFRMSSALLDPARFQIPSLPNQLRRVPGGDLKHANHVKSLEQPSRPKSAGSISTASRSFVPSGVLSLVTSAHASIMTHELRPEIRRSVSLLDTPSSAQILRASFEEEAKRLKGIPDEPGQDGGIEDALLKLEGKIPSPATSHNNSGASSQKRPSPQEHPDQADGRDKDENSDKHESPEISESPERFMTPEDDSSHGASEDDTTQTASLLIPNPLAANPPEPPPTLKDMPNGELKMTYGPYLPFEGSSGQGSGNSPTITETQGASIYHLSASGVQSMSSQTEYPLPSFPADLSPAGLASSTSILRKETRSSWDPRPNDPYHRADTPDSFPYERKPVSVAQSMSDGRYPSFRPGPWNGTANDHTSFPVDDTQTLSEISTEIAASEMSDLGVRSFYYDDDELPPIRPFAPPTPPSTSGDHQVESPDKRHLLPRLLPRDPDRPLKESISAPRLVPQTANQPFPRRPPGQSSAVHRRSPETPTFPAHMPFVLAFESEVIAEQLTIIEKDALDEVDWKDLVSLNWAQSAPYVRNWVDYVNNDQSVEANGIDIVIARFNLVVKWCISEIVLTEVPSERARAITKYIHIASHCHRLHNFASLYQLTLALLSPELARLQSTWSLVAHREKQMLESLEQLCRPLRNFHTLRAEMETAMPHNGIIPFIGLYTHDLMFNALKSSRIDPPGGIGSEPLINFERYQTAATIVKNLLRLIEASSKYNFRPEPEALSRCLWIAALEDDDITKRSKALEQI